MLSQNCKNVKEKNTLFLLITKPKTKAKRKILLKELCNAANVGYICTFVCISNQRVEHSRHSRVLTKDPYSIERPLVYYSKQLFDLLKIQLSFRNLKPS